MTITITSLRLRNLWDFFKLSWISLGILLQAKKSPGFISMKNTGFGYLHFTMSAWESSDDMKKFAHSGTHLSAMGKSRLLSTEIRIYSYAGDTLPSWNEAKVLLNEKAKVINYSPPR